MKYLGDSFSVFPGGNKNYRDNYDSVFGPKEKPITKNTEIVEFEINDKWSTVIHEPVDGIVSISFKREDEIIYSCFDLEQKQFLDPIPDFSKKEISMLVSAIEKR